MSKDLAKRKSTEAGLDPESELQTKLAGVDGTVRDAVVQRIRALVDQNPQQFVQGLRGLLHQGRTDD